MRPTDRRHFLQKCSSRLLSTGIAAGLSTGVVAGGAGGRAGQVQAIEPIVRNGSAKFKFSLAAYSYRDLLTGDPPQLTLGDFVDDCARMNLEGTELTSYYFSDPVTDDYLRGLKQQCFRLGLDVSGTAVGNDFGLPPGEERDRQIAAVKQWVEHAEKLGAPVIRIFAGKEKEGISPARSHALMVEGIEECCDYAGAHGVHLALENHGGPTATPEGMLAFVRDVQSPWFGVNFDSGNFYGADPYEQLAKIAPYALNVQIKVVTTDESRQKKRPTDFARLANMLREVGYRGYIVLEYEEAGDPRQECRRYLERVREAFTG
jgi:sugar phosphate isomerase/epimerase